MMLDTFHNAEFSNDRFGKPNSALLLNHGHVKVPPGEYFDPATGGFTIMLWIKPLSSPHLSPFFDFGSGRFVDNVIYQMQTTTQKLRTYISNAHQTTTSKSAINLNEWTHIAFTVSGGAKQTQYINGILDHSESGIFFKNI